MQTEPKKDLQERKQLELREIEQALCNINYGSILITIQDGKIVQIDKNEKIRFR